jgi:hypothetical protein
MFSSNIERRKAPFVWANSVSIVSVSIIIASALVLVGGFAPYSLSPMPIPNAFAQEEDYDNTKVGASTTMNNDTITTTATTTSSS